MLFLKVMKRALTLIELLMVAILIGIMAAMALPNYSKHLERGRGREAEANLALIYNAQKRYRLDNNIYFTCAPNCTADSINENLTLNIQDAYFNYSIGSSGSNESGFIAIATRRDRDCQGKIMSITDNGGPAQKECPAWQ